MLRRGGGGGTGGLRCIPLEKKNSKRVSADEEDDEDDYGKRDYMYGWMYVCTYAGHAYMYLPGSVYAVSCTEIISAD